MDPISAAANVITTVEIAGRISSICYTYFVAVKDARSDIQRLQQELTSLQSVLTQVADHATESKHDDKTRRDILAACQNDLEDLSRLLDNRVGNTEKLHRFGLRALRWPLSAKQTDKYLTAIVRHRGGLLLALQADLLEHSSLLVQNAADLRAALSKMQLSVTDHNLRSWLNPLDTFTHLELALDKRVVASTGSWFLEGDTYRAWQTQAGSMCWLTGITGSGKTVLTASVIAYLIKKFQPPDQLKLGLFFFDSSSPRDFNALGMVRSLLWQIATTSQTTMDTLEEFREAYFLGKQSTGLTLDKVLEALKNVIRQAGEVAIVIDALDESHELERVLSAIRVMRAWKLSGLRLFVTSREIPAIHEELAGITDFHARVEGPGVAADIETYIDHSISSNKRLNRWPDSVKDRIRSSLKSSATGMFRWVECQLDVLSKCITINSVTKALTGLPKTLGKTYELMLSNIDPEHRSHARRLLLWLSCTLRPLTLIELSEVTGIDGDRFSFSEDDCVLVDDIECICPALVSISTPHPESHGENHPHNKVMRLAHASVKEFLFSQDIKTGSAAFFSLDSGSEKQDPHAQISLECVGYMEEALNPPKNEDETEQPRRYPLSLYCAQYWMAHAQLGNKSSKGRCTEFLKSSVFEKSLEIFDSDLERPRRSGKDAVPGSALYYAALGGLHTSVWDLVATRENVNARGGSLVTPLHAAIFNSHTAVTQVLLENGADPNASSKEFGSVLQLAAIRNDLENVQLLLQSGADPNYRRGGSFESPLLAATYHGDADIINLLLDYGASLQMEGMATANALQLAAFNGDVRIVRSMLEAGFSANSPGQFGSPLGAALAQRSSMHKMQEIVDLLLSYGADPNERSSNKIPSALRFAVRSGNAAAVKSLMEAGILQFISPREYIECKVTAAGAGNDEILNQFQMHEADSQQLQRKQSSDSNCFRIRELNYETYLKLFAECLEQEKNDALRLKDRRLFMGIREKQLRVMRGGMVGDTLLKACETENTEIVKLVVQAGTHVAPYNPEVLQVAIPFPEITQILLENGLDVKKSSCPYALSIAVRRKHRTVVETMLDSGIDIDAPADRGLSYAFERGAARIGVGDANALINAAESGSMEIVKLLLDRGATVEASSQHWGTVLHAAALTRELDNAHEITQLLLQHGADVNAFEIQIGTPLHVAACTKKLDVARLLVANGAKVDIELHSTFEPRKRMADVDPNSTPLHISVRRRDLEMSSLLIESGASTSTLTDGGENLFGSLLKDSFWADLQDEKAQEHVISLITLLSRNGVRASVPCGGTYHSPLQAAVGFKDLAVINVLLSLGADVNSVGGEYGTPLLAAVVERWSEGVEALIDAGSDISQANDVYGTPLEYAKRENWTDGIQLLLKGLEHKERSE